MITLSEETKSIITSAVKYCSLVKISSLLIDKSGIRAKQDATAVYLIEPGDFNFLEFDTLYITRIESLAPRIKMFESSKKRYDLCIDVKELDNEDTLVKSLTLKNEQTQISFGCSVLPEKSRLPKKVNDPLFYEFECQKESLDVLSKGISAMGASLIKIYTDDGGVSCKVKDIESDSLKHTLASEYKYLSKDADEEFEFEYDFKGLLPLLKEAAQEESKFTIQLTRRGIIRLYINDLSIYIFAEA